MMGEIHEKCGVVGVSLEDPSQPAAYIARTLLARVQHRGTDAAGIVSGGSDLPLYSRRSHGLVTGVFTDDKLEELRGPVAIGHVQYPTDKAASSKVHIHPQPSIDLAIRLALAHNGTLPVTTQLRDVVEGTGIKPAFHNDSELALLALATIIRGGPCRLRDGIKQIFPRMQGAFSCVAMQDGQLIAFRDAYGIRPLEYGSFKGGLAIASETCAFEDDITHLDSVNPGEMIIFSEGKEVDRQQLAKPHPRIDSFEFVYFASPASVIAGKSVYQVRHQLGQELATLHPPADSARQNTIVVPTPMTSYPIAAGYANTLGLPLEPAIHKDPYTTRTFILPNHGQRTSALNRKHTVISSSVHDKDVIVIDDSLVRGNTARVLMSKLRAAGARSIALLFGSPPIRYPDFYGINIASQAELPAATMNIADLREDIGCDYLGFLPISGLVRAIGLPRTQLNLSAFNGQYPIDIGQINRNSIKPPVDTMYID